MVKKSQRPRSLWLENKILSVITIVIILKRFVEQRLLETLHMSQTEQGCSV